MATNHATKSTYVNDRAYHLPLDRTFKIALFATLFLKLLFAALLPFTGDEAYFAIWGNYFDWGYYDHPPMVGWLAIFLKSLGDSALILRLPAVLITPALALGIFFTLKKLDEEKAYLVGLLFLFSPIYLIEIFHTTDIPLILFSFFSVLALHKAEVSGRFFYYAASGALLGLAFLSKYFAGFLGVAYLFYFIFGAARKNLRGYATLILCALPFVAVNIYWNYGHCWSNLLFNVYNRHEDAGWSPTKVLLYLAMLAYLITPPILFSLWKQRAQFNSPIAPAFKVFIYTALVPLFIFLLFSSGKVIGLHWVLSFLPFLFLSLPLFLTSKQLHGAVKFMLVFAILHGAVLAAILIAPIESWRELKKYPSIVMTAQTDELLVRLAPYKKDFVLAADAYSPAAILTHHTGTNVPVFGLGSSHARHDDIMTDFRTLQGKNLLIFKKQAPKLEEYLPYFHSVSMQTINLRGAVFYLILGYNFNYPLYHMQILENIRHRYYALPSYLPLKACYFCERYFSANGCGGAPAAFTKF